MLDGLTTLVGLATAAVLAGASPSEPRATGPDDAVRTLSGGEVGGALPADMVLVPGGSPKLGVERAAMLEIGEQNRADRLPEMMAMYPEYVPDDRLEDFLMDIYEVTNAQYKAFLDDTGREPSEHVLDYSWFVWESGEKVLGYTDGIAELPIRGLNWEEARDYCDWAGKRLPTEQEWEHAARFDLDRDWYYLWGEGWKAWKSTECCNVANSVGRSGQFPSAVGSFPADRNTLGIFDLCGNVTEWTSSPFVPYPRHQPIELKVDRRKQTFRAAFQGDQRVIRGGTFLGNKLICNVVFRQGLAPTATFEEVGFRCVVDAAPGLGILRRAQKRQLSLLGGEVRDNLDISLEGAAAQQVFPRGEDRLNGSGKSLAFARVKSIPKSKARLLRDSLEEPVLVGVFVTTEASASPQLPAGAYGVYLRGEGETDAQKEARKNGREEKEEDEAGDEDEDQAKDEGKEDDEDEEAQEGEELTEEQKAELERIRQEEAEAKAALEKLGAVATVRGIDPLDLPIDSHLLLIVSNTGDIAAYSEIEWTEGDLDPTTLSYQPLGGKVEGHGVGTSSNAMVVGEAQNDLARFDFGVRISGSSKRGPQFSLELEFPAETFHKMDAPTKD